MRALVTPMDLVASAKTRLSCLPPPLPWSALPGGKARIVSSWCRRCCGSRRDPEGVRPRFRLRGFCTTYGRRGPLHTAHGCPPVREGRLLLTLGAWRRGGRRGARTARVQGPPSELLRRRGRASNSCLLYTSPSPRDKRQSRMPSSA